MKRSEMVAYLEEQFEGLDINADTFLCNLEAMGMVPPINEEKSWQIADPDTSEETYEVHEWEAECSAKPKAKPRRKKA